MITANVWEWAKKWGIPQEAVRDLLQSAVHAVPPPNGDTSESAIQARARLEASYKGVYLWRNNVGACVDQNGRMIRYGLANDSKQINEVIKSGDLIGIRPVDVTPDMVGQRIGQFISRECKRGDWVYRGTKEEKAQLQWQQLVNMLGGDAAFLNGENQL